MARNRKLNGKRGICDICVKDTTFYGHLNITNKFGYFLFITNFVKVWFEIDIILH